MPASGAQYVGKFERYKYMRVLFIVQGEGRGHLTQALTMEALLRREGHEVVGALVGKSSARELPAFFTRGMKAPVSRFDSPNFLPTPANKRSSLPRSVAYNVLRMAEFARSVWMLHKRIEAGDVDLVVNFYELLTGLTYLLFRPTVPQISIGHQYMFLHNQFDFPDKNRFSLWSLRFFTRLTCIGACRKLALSFYETEDDEAGQIQIVPPLLRQEVLACEGQPGNYLHGYMVNAGFGENIMAWHKAHPETSLHFFWDKRDEEREVCRIDDTLSFHQIDDMKFLRYMAGCKAYATTAGFESVCEAMYLGKPLLMVPAHIEQDCNAHDAARYGAGIVADDFDLERLLAYAEHYQLNTTFRYWVRSAERIIMQSIETTLQTEHYPLPVMPVTI